MPPRQRHSAAREKFQANAETCFPPERIETILAMFDDVEALERMASDEFMEFFFE